jgi:hypothetical protein
MPAGYRQRNYHLFLAKKYLWVNQRPDATRRHLSMVFRANNFSLEAAALYMMSFLPKRWVRLLYSIKSSSGEAK